MSANLPRVRDVLTAAAAVCGTTIEEVYSKHRDPQTIEARELFVGYCRDQFHVPPSFPELGRVVGRHSHSGAHCQYLRWRRRPAEYREARTAEVAIRLPE